MLPTIFYQYFEKVWQKVRSIWTYAYDHYLNEYDYFYIAGDDVYMAVENLRAYLEGPEVKRLQEGYLDSISGHVKYRWRAQQTAMLHPRPLLLSTPMMWKQIPVIAGGAGYIINQAALKVWGERGADLYEKDTFDSREDFLFGKFLADQGIFISDTRDESGASRFGIGADFAYHFKGISPVNPKRLKALFDWEIKRGMDVASQEQISFHLKDDMPHLESLGQNNTIAELMLRYHAILFGWCDGVVSASATTPSTTAVL
jgi:glycoprotein-N-acetylgalactosamine 3-beta-galactosyltransferase